MDGNNEVINERANDIVNVITNESTDEAVRADETGERGEEINETGIVVNLSEGIHLYGELRAAEDDETPKEFDSLVLSNFRLLRGALEHLSILNILPYLCASELCAMGSTSAFFRRICASPILWHARYRWDFDMQKHDISGGSLIEVRNQNNTFSKRAYQLRYAELHDRIHRSKAEKAQFALDLQRQDRVTLMEKILDLTQVRIIVPLFLISVFLSVTLYCQRVDGLNISLWVCAIPLITSLTYTILSMWLVQIMYAHQYSSTHLLRGMWNNFRGPIVFFFREVCGESRLGLYAAMGVVALGLLQLLLVVVKVSVLTPDHIENTLPWSVVFLPMWLLFLAYCVSPMFPRFRLDAPLYLLLFALLWVPFLIFFIGLAVKLTGADDHTKSSRIRIALLLMPFWIIEGVILLASLGFLIFGIYRYRRGYLERLDEHYMVFSLCWVSLVPFVIFQALLSARDDDQLHNHDRKHTMGATEVVVPLLIILGWICFVSIAVSKSFRTAYQMSRLNSLSNSAGLRVILAF